MPKKKEHIKENVFLITILFALSLIILTVSLMTKHVSLNCFMESNSIRCEWTNCLSDEGSEIILAKAPDYVEIMSVTEDIDSVVFNPSPLAGTYTALLTCKNGEVAQPINIS